MLKTFLLSLVSVLAYDYENAKRLKQLELEKDKPKELQQFEERPHSDQQLFVHMVPHTHDDLGWIKTVEEYYSGFAQDQTHATVSIILDSVIEQMEKRPWTKFTYVEMKFFSMWYNSQPQSVKDKVKKFVKEGRFEFLNGGWSANDEACPTHEDILDNMMKGHEFLKKEFGVVPRVGWLLDSFGHSSANARLYAEMGLEAIFFGRLDHNDIELRFNAKSLNFLWRPFAEHFGKQNQILTSVFRDHYCWPPGFYVDERYDADESFQPDATLPKSYNGEVKAVELINYVQNQARHRRENHLMLPWGCDFAWSNARLNYDQMDKIIAFVNRYNTKNITFMYSTPSQYLDALKKDDYTWATKYDDGFPYSDHNEQFWTGFFSSRPNKKKQTRDLSANMHASQQMFAMKVLEKDISDEKVSEILKAKEEILDTMGVLQHHDAITGTERQRVADDYAGDVVEIMEKNNKAYSNELIEALKKRGVETQELVACTGTKDTVFDCPTQNQTLNEFVLVAHNPNSLAINQFLRAKLPSNKYKAMTWSEQSSSFVDTKEFDILEQAHWQNDSTTSNQTKEFSDFEIFIQQDIAPNGISFVKIVKVDSAVQTEPKKQEGSKLEITGFDDQNEALFNFTQGSFHQSFGITLKQYKAKQVQKDLRQDYGPDDFMEGAYLFVPEGNQSYQYSQIDPNVVYEQGRNIEQWTIKFSQKGKNYAIIKVRSSPYFKSIIEFEVELSSIDVSDKQGKDVIVAWRMYDNFNANQTFWTDSNGLEMQERRINYQKTFSLAEDNQKIAPNFYPVVSAIAMRDASSGKQVTVMNDRTQAGSADIDRNATIELMQHRRLLQDDLRGLNEPLNEVDSNGNGIKVNAKYYMQIFDRFDGISKQRQKQIEINMPIQYFFASSFKQITPQSQQDSQEQQFKSFKTGFYQLYPLAKGKIMVRIENLADRFDNAAQVKELDLEQFANYLWSQANPGVTPPKVVIQEVSLSGNQLKEENDAYKKNYTWKGEDDATFKSRAAPTDKSATVVSLEPQRIRNFVFDFGLVQQPQLLQQQDKQEQDEDSEKKVQEEPMEDLPDV